LGYLLTVDVAVAMYDMSFYEPFFWIDDVYVTGFLVHDLSDIIVHTDISHTILEYKFMEAVCGNSTEWYKYTFTHVNDTELYIKTWSKLTTVSRQFPIPRHRFVIPGQFGARYVPPSTILLDYYKANKQFKQKRMAAPHALETESYKVSDPSHK
jgi:hypothetical protein